MYKVQCLKYLSYLGGGVYTSRPLRGGVSSKREVNLLFFIGIEFCAWSLRNVLASYGSSECIVLTNRALVLQAIFSIPCRVQTINAQPYHVCAFIDAPKIQIYNELIQQYLFLFRSSQARFSLFSLFQQYHSRMIVGGCRKISAVELADS